MVHKFSRFRRFLFNSLVVINFLLSLLAGIIFYLQMGREIAWLPKYFEPVENYFGLSFENAVRPIALFAVITFFYIVAYFLSFDFFAKKRPKKRVILLHAEIAFVIVCGLAGLFDLSLNALSALLVVFIMIVYPAILWGLERLIASAASSLGQTLLSREKYRPGMKMVHLGILLCPDQIHLRKLLGAARYEAGDVPGTISVLEPLVDEETDDLPMLEALEECYRTERLWEKVLRICQMRLAQQPDRHALRSRTARVLEKLDRHSEAVQVLRDGLPVQNLEYLEQLLEYLRHLKDLDAAVDVVQMMQKLEHLPRPRCLSAYRSILEIEPHNQSALEDLADLLIEGGNPEEGNQIYERMLEIAAERHDLRRRLVQYYQENGLMDRAEPHLEALMDAGQETADVALLYGDILVQREEYDRALSHLHFVVERYPEDFRFAYFLAQVSFKTQALEEALRWLDVAAEKEASAEDRNRMQGLRRRIEDSLVDRDMRALQERCNRDPENMDLRLTYIQEMVRHGMAEKAIVEYDDLLEEHPELKPRIVEQMEANAASPEPSFRLMDYLSDLKIKDQLWDEVFQLAELMAARSMHGKRLLADHARRILNRKPDHLPSVQVLGESLEHENKWQEALDVYQRYLEFVPDSDVREIRRGIFFSHANLGNVEEAIERGEAYLREFDHDIDVRIKLIQVFLEQDRYDEALQHLQRAQSSDYYNPEVTKLMREVSQQRRKQQLEYLLGFIEKDPGNTAAHLEAAEIYILLGDPKKAIPHLQRASQDPELKNIALARLGNAMTRLHMFDLAEETLDEVKFHPDNPEELNLIKVLFFDSAEIFEAEEQTPRALKFYKKIFRVDASFRNVVDKIEVLGG